MVRALLESSGIRVFLKDELTVTAYHFYSDAIGGIRIFVSPEDKEKALEVLSLPPLDIPGCTCPLCGSSNIRYKRLSRMNAIFLFIGFCLPLKKKEMFCLNCNRIFKEQDLVGPKIDTNEDLLILTAQALEAPRIPVKEKQLPIYLRMLKWAVLLPLVLWILSPIEHYLHGEYPSFNFYAAASFAGAFFTWLFDKSNEKSTENPDIQGDGGENDVNLASATDPSGSE